MAHTEEQPQRHGKAGRNRQDGGKPQKVNIFYQLIDTGGTRSSARFLNLVTVLSVLSVWAFVSIYTVAMADIPMGVVGFVSVVVVGKTVQSFAEREL